MRNVLPTGPGVCEVCHTFIDPDRYSRCYACGFGANDLDAVVPITYSEHLGQVHTVLSTYKNGLPSQRGHLMTRLASILWLFLEQHERCVAVAAGARHDLFDVVVTVPSSTRERDDARGNLRWLVSEGCAPTKGRFVRALRPSATAPTGRDYGPGRYDATLPVDDADVLLVDDTWTTGGHAQSAATALKLAGARTVALVVIGRHVQPGWSSAPGVTNAQNLKALPKPFDWEACCVHQA